MSKDYGALVLGRDKDPSDPWQPGDRTDVYTLLDPFEVKEAPPMAAKGVSWDAHRWSCQQADRIATERKAGQLRETGRIRCTCKGRPSIATEFVDQSGHTWVLVGAERVPAAFRRSDLHDPEQRAFPLHTHPDGTVHPEVTTCRRCNQDWVIGIGSTRVQVARVRATRGGTVTP